MSSYSELQVTARIDKSAKDVLYDLCEELELRLPRFRAMRSHRSLPKSWSGDNPMGGALSATSGLCDKYRSYIGPRSMWGASSLDSKIWSMSGIRNHVQSSRFRY